MKNIKLNSTEIGIMALGGLGEVGKNTYVFEIDKKIFIVDAGIMFPGLHLLGVDYIVPNYEYLVKNQERIVGLFITHAHEDHIGGIPYLLKYITLPAIYACGIAINLIEFKFQENPDITVPTLVNFNSSSEFVFGSVKISFIRLNHSIPDMMGIVFHTSEGVIFHTGDFKIDLTPVGPHAEYYKLAKIGEEGVLCLLSDSTNAEREELITSESKVGKTIKELFSNIKGRILIATFASNLYRVQQIIEATEESGRKLLVSGRSMERTIEAGVLSGYINIKGDTIIDIQDLDVYDKKEIVVLLTGSQGEPFAALSRIANGTHKNIQLVPNDTIIFSSSPIPGNQEGINKTINFLFRNGVEVITHGPLADTHSSGHASQNDLKLMLNLTKPKYFIPVHGEHRMQKIHKKLAIECGVVESNIKIVDNGEMVILNKDFIQDPIVVTDGSPMYICGNHMGVFNEEVFDERKKLSNDGIVIILITMRKETGLIEGDIQIISRGFIYMKGNEEYTKNLQNIAVEIVNRDFNYYQNDINSFKELLSSTILKIIKESTLRTPIIRPEILFI